MNVSHKISEFRPSFSRKQRKTKLAQFQNMCTTPTYTSLRKIEQISDILLISLKRGWSDLKLTKNRMKLSQYSERYIIILVLKEISADLVACINIE